ncbi:MAG TPA: sigma-54 dependent transcriptional regulator [Pseudomonadales bacterium]|nr:sigma-54 dependent transcriptional regulator [Pseudomonadales bacterium]
MSQPATSLAPIALIVDDEPDIRELLEITLGRMQLRTRSTGTLEGAKQILHDEKVSICLTDMQLPDGNGITLVQHIQSTCPHIPVAVITAFGSMDTAINALKAGAFDFVSKPVNLEQLRGLVNTAINLQKNPVSTDSSETELLTGDSEVMQKLRKQIAKLARSQAPIYIYGESGTGKELAARSIHLQGPRAAKPFVAVNCGAIPSELMESEFFGHKKGSFTGATADKTGLFQAAHGGTLFLDEVADLPLEMQVKLLRAIQEKSVRAVGAEKEQEVDVRILSATHKNLAEEVKNGKFRQDLFYRINVIELAIPPLRERGGDIIKLAQRFLASFAMEMQLPPATISEDAKAALLRYDFPGNVRELENILERAYTLCDEDTITLADLHLGENENTSLSLIPDSSKIEIPEDVTELDKYLESIERGIITRALEANRWNKTVTAQKLGISFRQLRYRLKKLGMDD